MSGPAPRIVVDASIAVKWFMADGEDDVEAALWLLELSARGQVKLAAPAHMRLESINALVSRRVPIPDVLMAARDLQGFSLEWHDMNEALSFEAVSLAASHGLTVYDAAYLALANELDACLVTADRSLAEAAGERLVHVVDLPADPPYPQR